MHILEESEFSSLCILGHPGTRVESTPGTPGTRIPGYRYPVPARPVPGYAYLCMLCEEGATAYRYLSTRVHVPGNMGPGNRELHVEYPGKGKCHYPVPGYPG